MPRISTFFGIDISMYYREHNPPHFHAEYAGYEALIDIRNFEILSGYLPPRALGLVIEWSSLHRDELLKNWENSEKKLPLNTIKPLE